MDRYLVPGEFGQIEYVEKRSRFIGHVWRVHSEEEAMLHITQTRKKYSDATHNVHAYLLMCGASRCTDDGEPKGTAGMPVLEVFRKSGVSDVCCIVTRYFGGVLLGAGGLTRAYGKAAALALEEAGVFRMRTWTTVRLECGYALYEPVRQRFEALGGTVKDTAFGSSVEICGLVPEGQSEPLASALRELSSGRVEPVFLGNTELPEPVAIK